MLSPVSRILLEVIVASAGDARLAEQGGADRVELVTEIPQGGLTPQRPLIERVLAAVRIPVHVMVRPHSHSFVYAQAVVPALAEQTAAIRRLGASGIVFGALTTAQTIDEAALGEILDAADGLPITFHRAFDEVADQFEAIGVLLRYPGVARVLTSGGQASARDGIDRIRGLVDRTQGTHLTVMAGRGLTLELLANLVTMTGVREVHFGSGVRIGGDQLAPVDLARVKAAKETLARLAATG